MTGFIDIFVLPNTDTPAVHITTAGPSFRAYVTPAQALDFAAALAVHAMKNGASAEVGVLLPITSAARLATLGESLQKSYRAPGPRPLLDHAPATPAKPKRSRPRPRSSG